MSATSAGGVAGRLRAFGAFWYDFVVGDDWQVAAFVIVALVLTAVTSAWTTACWWIMPIAVAVLLPLSVWRVVRRTP